MSKFGDQVVNSLRKYPAAWEFGETKIKHTPSDVSFYVDLMWCDTYPLPTYAFSLWDSIRIKRAAKIAKRTLVQQKFMAPLGGWK